MAPPPIPSAEPSDISASQAATLVNDPNQAPTTPPARDLSERDQATLARKHSARLDRALRAEAAERAQYCRLLLLGTAESGKSTVLKQMKLIHTGNLLDVAPDGVALPSATSSVAVLPSVTPTSGGVGELGHMGQADWVVVIRKNLFDSLALIVQYQAEHVATRPWATLDAESAAATLRSMISDLQANPSLSTVSTDQIVQVVAAIQALSTDATLRDLIRIGGQFQLLDSADAFIRDAATILDPSYAPSNDHILLARQPTTNITETKIVTAQGYKYLVYDVNGSRRARHTWVQFFDDVLCILYVAPISSYDQPLPPGDMLPRTAGFDDAANFHRPMGPMSRLLDSLLVFEQIMRHPLLKTTAVIVFLNKIDVLRAKLVDPDAARVADYFPDYHGPQEFDPVCHYVSNRFADAVRGQTARKLYIHLTWATQTQQIQVVLNTVNKILIKLNLAKVNLV
ncbi:Guanine nucleotide-binding protein G(t) subunit alpha-1 [Allomyces javanicus]|nr:Guanine nucleotide-binding protein G(t) subunit alpha-1 [Allomyces javanicus]